MTEFLFLLAGVAIMILGAGIDFWFVNRQMERVMKIIRYWALVALVAVTTAAFCAALYVRAAWVRLKAERQPLERQ